MTEVSQPWDGTLIGDAALRAPYTASRWADMFRDFFRNAVGTYLDDGGIFAGVGDELVPEVLGVGSLRVGTGAALVNDRWYYNDTAIDWAIPACATPGSTRIDRMVLSAAWVDYNSAVRSPAVQQAQTVRMIRKIGTDGLLVPPPLINNDGAIWETDIVAFEVTDAGVITLRPDLANRQFLNKFIQARTRCGGSDTHWDVGGTTGSFIRGAPFMQFAAVEVTVPNGAVSGMTTYTYITPYVQSRPLITTGVLSADCVAGAQIPTAAVGNISLTDCDVWATRANPGDTNGDEVVTVLLTIIGNYGHV